MMTQHQFAITAGTKPKKPAVVMFVPRADQQPVVAKTKHKHVTL